MNAKKFEKLIHNFEFLVDERMDTVLNKLKERKEYKEKYEKYSNLYDSLLKKYSRKDIEEFAGANIDLYNIENSYIYIQGLIDGIILKDFFVDKNKSN